LYRRNFGHPALVSEQENEPRPEPDPLAGEEDELLREQEGKGYGGDEGERDESFPDE
jgi:hypothetical protein